MVMGSGAEEETRAETRNSLQAPASQRTRARRHDEICGAQKSPHRPIVESSTPPHTTTARTLHCPLFFSLPTSLSLTHSPPTHSTTQPFNHSTTQPLNHSTTQPLNHSTTQPLNHSTTQPLNHSTTQPLNHSTTQPLNHSTTQPLKHSTTQPLNHSFTQLLEYSLTTHSTTHTHSSLGPSPLISHCSFFVFSIRQGEFLASG